jgi:NADP-dependent 3-hydroxy acid dehydrogenase YdfG
VFSEITKREGRLDVLINNAGIASMNHSLLTPMTTVNKIIQTNFIGTFLLCREAARLMQSHRYGRIVNFATVAVPLKLEGEAVYAASKAAVISLTQILAREFGEFGITDVSQQDCLVRSGHEDLLSNHFLAEIVCGKAAVSVGLDLRHPRMRIREGLRPEFH